MGNERLIEFPQCLGRRFLLGGTNLASDLSAPKQIVTDDDAARVEFWQTEIEIAAVFFFHRVDENKIERFVELWNDFQRVPFLNAHTLANLRSLKIFFSSPNHLITGFDGDNEAVVRHRAREVNHR